ncbi:hypothetical protein [Paenibacillus pabuli]|uniref:hypothetical protein n=1 Tax=Paenibacillus pabuli TaxID=1472 RepID=UPI002000042A|nr:hypothetical protein [Paenibacillus pabuli]UPK41169.1 hypothetical protein KET34_17805 [Paenibacillus pabuli]
MPETLVTVDFIEKSIQEALTNGRLYVTSLNFLPEEIRKLLFQITDRRSFIVESAEVVKQNEEVVLNGKMSLLGLLPMNGTIHFKVTQEKLELFADIQSDVPQRITTSIGIMTVNLSDIGVKINAQADGMQSAVLSSNVQIEGQAIQFTMDLLGDKLFQGEIATFSLQRLISICCARQITLSGLPDLTIQNIQFSIGSRSEGEPLRIKADIPDLGQIHLLVFQYHSFWHYVVVLSLPQDWKLSKISDIFKVFDSLQIEEQELIYSSITHPAVPMKLSENASPFISVMEGCSFSGKLKMEGLGLEVLRLLFQIPELQIGGMISPNLPATRLVSQLEKSISLFGVTFNDVGLVLQPEPFVIAFQLSTIIQIQNDRLPFSGSIELQQTGASYKLAMQGIWSHPFGIPMFDIGNVVLEFQTNPDPKLAVAGDIQLGDDLKISVACRFTASGVPDTLFGNLDGELSTSRLIRAFTDLTLPEGFIDVSVSNVLIYIVANPLGTKINGVQMPFGFRVHGKMNAFGLEVAVQAAVVENGITFDGQMDPIQVGNVLKVYGESPEQGAKIVYHSLAREPFLFQLDAGIQLLGVTLQTHILIKPEKLEFSFTEKIFNLFEASIQAETTGSLRNGELNVKANMQNDMLQYFNNETRRILQESASVVRDKITQVQSGVDNLENQLESLGVSLQQRKDQIDNDKSAKEQTVQAAEDEVRRIRDEITLNQRSLDDVLRRIAEILLDPTGLRRLKEERDRLRNLINDLDGHLGNAQTVATAAHDTLSQIVPLELDPTYLGFESSIQIANEQLEMHRNELGVLQRLAGKYDVVTGFIQAQGLPALFEVNRISFEGNIQSVGEGHVSLSMDIHFIGGSQHLDLDFSFQDPLSGVKALSDRLVQALP